jgi:hypothetical protein
MFRFILIAITVILTGCSTIATSDIPSYGPFLVKGYGNNLEEAKQAAFRSAVEEVMGTVIVSEKEVANSNVIKNQILTHSSGYIESFEIVNTQINPNTMSHTIIMKVTIKPTMINDYKLYIAKSNTKFEGEQLMARLESYTDERNKGDAMLKDILNDFPERGLDIKVGEISFQLNDNRDKSISIPYELSLNNNYLANLARVLHSLEDIKCVALCDQVPKVMVKYKEKGKFVAKTETIYFNDMVKNNLVESMIFGRQGATETVFALKVEFLSFDRRVLNTFCYKVPDLNIPGGSNTNSVWLNHQLRKHNGEIPINIYKNWVVKTNGGKYKLNMKEVNSIEVKSTSQRKCDLGNNVLM